MAKLLLRNSVFYCALPSWASYSFFSAACNGVASWAVPFLIGLWAGLIRGIRAEGLWNRIPNWLRPSKRGTLAILDFPRHPGDEKFASSFDERVYLAMDNYGTVLTNKLQRDLDDKWRKAGDLRINFLKELNKKGVGEKLSSLIGKILGEKSVSSDLREWYKSVFILLFDDHRDELVEFLRLASEVGEE